LEGEGWRGKNVGDGEAGKLKARREAETEAKASGFRSVLRPPASNLKAQEAARGWRIEGEGLRLRLLSKGEASVSIRPQASRLKPHTAGRKIEVTVESV
jgi:hypothetical protein